MNNPSDQSLTTRGEPLSDPRSGAKSSTGTKEELLPGTKVGQYRVIRLLGRGGMGEVYEVEHQVLKRRFALKLLPSTLAWRSNALNRFQREARVMANLEHPNILRVDEFGETDGRYWLRMELASGVDGDPGLVSLADLAAARGGKLPQEEWLRILRQVLEGLAFAHEHGTVHRDIKPSNIVFQGSVAKIADFGLVKLVGEEWVRTQTELSVSRSLSIGDAATGEGNTAGTSTRSLLGTYQYMSPEQKRGEEAEARSDLYAVGLMTFRLLTGWQDPGFDLPTDIDASLAHGWNDFVRRVLAPARERRPENCGELLRMLEGIVAEIEIGRLTGASKASLVAEVRDPAGYAWTVPDVGMAFVEVPAGTFRMGSTYYDDYDGDDDDYNDEKPVHEVRITRPFWIGKFEVTNGEYKRFLDESKYDGKGDADGFYLEHFRGESDMPTDAAYPICCVSWKNSVAFCKWLTERERFAGRLPSGYAYRLPTEAEWEYAARGGPGSRGFIYSGSNDLNEVGWFCDNSGKKTHEVGGKRANELGIHDMSGSIFEWCLDWYDDYPNGVATDPRGPQTGSDRVIRGGSWGDNARDCRVAFRFYFDPSYSFYGIGFRAALGPSQ